MKNTVSVDNKWQALRSRFGLVSSPSSVITGRESITECHSVLLRLFLSMTFRVLHMALFSFSVKPRVQSFNTISNYLVNLTTKALRSLTHFKNCIQADSLFPYFISIISAD